MRVRTGNESDIEFSGGKKYGTLKFIWMDEEAGDKSSSGMRLSLRSRG